jgi:hypothetical protein
MFTGMLSGVFRPEEALLEIHRKPLISLKKRSHFREHECSLNGQKFAHESQRGPENKNKYIGECRKLTDRGAQGLTGSVHGNKEGRIEISFTCGSVWV